MSKPFVIIIAGGRGERFWPESRLSRPKHLLPIVGDKPMLAQTLIRVRQVAPAANTYVITSAAQERGVRAVAVDAGVPSANVIAEPVGRDTAAAVALAAAIVSRRDPDGLFAVLPSDHVIHDGAAYRRDLKAAFQAAAAHQAIVTIGIKPHEPATGFGYIRKGAALGRFEGNPAFRVLEFCEKPDLPTAKRYLKSGKYLWNAGMFVWSVSVANQELARHAPGLHAAFQPVREARKGAAIGPLLAKIYPGLEKISIDYAVLEKSSNVVVLPSRFDWDDVGAWPAVARHYAADAEGNVGRGRTVVASGSNNIVFSDDDHLVAIVGADDLIVVHTADATMVCPRSRAEEIKGLLKKLAADRGGARWL